GLADVDAPRRRVVDRRRAVAVGEGRRHLVADESVDLGEDAARGLHVDVGVRTGAEDGVSTEDVEERELDVTDVALVVAHGGSFGRGPGGRRRSGAGSAARAGRPKATCR